MPKTSGQPGPKVPFDGGEKKKKKNYKNKFRFQKKKKKKIIIIIIDQKPVSAEVPLSEIQRTAYV